MRLAILGGSFNPVHLGHLALADAVLCSFSYDRLLLVPSFRNPFKDAAEGAGPQDRLDMLAASVVGDARIGIEDCEIRRGGVSYMIDTLTELSGRYQIDGKIGLVLGDDLAESFSSWRGADRLAEMVDFILGRRIPDAAAFPYPYTALKNSVLELSSSDLRRRIAGGDAWSYLVPAGAQAIIKDRGLYGLPSGTADPSVSKATTAQVEAYVRRTLSTDRFLHSRNVALQAVDLSIRFGLDVDGAYLAGIAHDMCKEFSPADLLRLATADGGGFTDLERKKPALLHARAAAVLLTERFAVDDPDILEAVRLHTSGAPGMGAPAKVLYIADKIEPRRDSVSAGLRQLSRTADLDTLFRKVLLDTVAYLRRMGKTVASATEALAAACASEDES